MTTREINSILSSAGLNGDQKAFCKLSPDKNIRLLAPAGAGKTFSLLWRCKVIEALYEPTKQKKGKPVPLPHILLIAFTRSARFELENRIEEQECFHGLNATVRTLNAWGWEQNRIPGRELLVTRRDRQSVILHDLRTLCTKYPAIASMLEGSRTRNANAATLMDVMDGYKSLGFTHFMKISQYKAYIKVLKELGLAHLLEVYQEQLLKMVPAKNKDNTKEAVAIEFFQFWKEAVLRIKENNRYTLEDQKYWARIYLEQQISAKKFPNGVARYTHIMVDEFQDINPLDMALIKDICLYHGQGKPTPLTIVGDDDQAIFGWRGTTPRFILEPERYVGIPFETCFLLTNYRSPKELTALSNKLLSYNKHREPKQIISVAKGKAYIRVVNDKSAYSTVETTLNLVHKLLAKPSIRQVALIGRRQVSLFPYQVMLSSEGTPYHVAADLDIFEGDAIKALLDIIRITYRNLNHDIDDPIEAVLTIADRIDRYKIQKSDRDSISAYLDKRQADSMETTIAELRDYPKQIKSMDANDVSTIIEELLASRTVFKFMNYILKNFRGLDQDYSKADTDIHYKSPQFSRLAEISVKYGSDFKKFYMDLEKARKTGERSRKRENDDSNAGYHETEDIPVRLLTATRSKGHEYDAVIVLDADDNEWPNRMNGDIEEERRLFHVAMSRAKKYLYFVTDSRNLESRFLLEAGVL